MKKVLFLTFAITVMVSVAMAQRVSDLKAGDRVPLSQRHPLTLGEGTTYSLNDSRVKEMMSVVDFNRCKEGRKAYLESGATAKGGNPSVNSITGSMAFFTVGIDTLATYFDYAGSTGPFDQVGFQVGKASASMFDTTIVQYVTANANDQLLFVRKNLISGEQYRFKFFVFDAANGTVTFYPAGNSCYYATTIFVAKATIVEFSMSCVTKKLYFWRNNNATAIIKGRVDSLLNFSSPYLPMHGVIVPFSRPKTNGVPVLDSINLASYMVAPGPIANYFAELSITINSLSLDSTNVEFCSVNTTGINELEARKAFKLFPNPNPTTVESLIDGRLDLLDLTGKIISSDKISAGSTVLNRKDVTPGLYFYQLSNTKGERIVTLKVIISE